MHELSIAKSIVEIAEAEVKKASAQRVEEIQLDIGKLAGVEYDALDFVWEAAVSLSVLSQAKRIINQIPGRGKCVECTIEFEMNNLFDACPECQQYFNEILQGKELKIKSLTIS